MQVKSSHRDGLWQFFALTFAISLLAWGVLIVAGIPGASTDPSTPPPSALGLLLLVLGGFAPSIAGTVMTALHEGAAGLQHLWQRAMQFRLGWRAYTVILGLPLLVTIVRAAVFASLGGVPGSSLLLESPAALAAFIVQIALFGPISEEFGWRGFALPRMLRRWTASRASLLLGALWALWHLPLFFVVGTSQWRSGNVLVEFPIFALVPLCSAFLYTWLHQVTRGSLWAALLFHFTANFCVSFWVTIADDGLAGRLAASAVMVLAAVVVVISWHRKPV